MCSTASIAVCIIVLLFSSTVVTSIPCQGPREDTDRVAPGQQGNHDVCWDPYCIHQTTGKKQIVYNFYATRK